VHQALLTYRAGRGDGTIARATTELLVLLLVVVIVKDVETTGSWS